VELENSGDRRQRQEALADGKYQQRWFHIMDKKNGLRFLIDTGTDISLVPR